MTENEIKDLRKHAYDVFKTEIPLSGEIEKIQLFLDQSKMGFKKVNPKLIKTVSATVQWCPNFWNYPLEIDIPDSVMDAIRDQCGNLLAQRCDELAGLIMFPGHLELLLMTRSSPVTGSMPMDGQGVR